MKKNGVKQLGVFVAVAMMCGASVMAEEAVEAERHEVVVEGVGEGVIEVLEGDESLRLVTPKKKKWLIRGLVKGDAVSVTFVKDGEILVLTSVEGSGEVVGEVVKIEKKFVSVKTEEGVTHRLMPRWIGGMPKDGGGHDKAVLEQIQALEVGQQVKMTWVIEEGKRVTGVVPVAQEEKENRE